MFFVSGPILVSATSIPSKTMHMLKRKGSQSSVPSLSGSPIIASEEGCSRSSAARGESLTSDRGALLFTPADVMPGAMSLENNLHDLESRAQSEMVPQPQQIRVWHEVTIQRYALNNCADQPAALMVTQTEATDRVELEAALAALNEASARPLAFGFKAVNDSL